MTDTLLNFCHIQEKKLKSELSQAGDILSQLKTKLNNYQDNSYNEANLSSLYSLIGKIAVADEKSSVDCVETMQKLSQNPNNTQASYDFLKDNLTKISQQHSHQPELTHKIISLQNNLSRKPLGPLVSSPIRGNEATSKYGTPSCFKPAQEAQYTSKYGVPGCGMTQETEPSFTSKYGVPCAKSISR